MNFIKTVKTLFLICILASCNSKKTDINSEIHIEKYYEDYFNELNQNKPEKAFTDEYYENCIIEFQRILPEKRKINTMMEIDNIVPGYTSFLVGWNDFNVGRGDDYDIILENYSRGNFFGLYTFDKNQNIINEYLVGYKNYLDTIRNILLDELPGNKPSHGLISYGDFNNDGINEILSIYLYPPKYEYVFTVFGYNVNEKDFTPTLLVPIYINFEQPFPPVKYIENGFTVLEVLEYEPLELVWNNYIWDKNMGKYIRE